MDIRELNNLIDDMRNDGMKVTNVSKDIYPEVEELYMKTNMTKIMLAEFYAKFDYIGVRNALEIINNITEFKNDVFDTVFCHRKNILVSPSQKSVLDTLNIDFEELSPYLYTGAPWTSKTQYLK